MIRNVSIASAFVFAAFPSAANIIVPSAPDGQRIVQNAASDDLSFGGNRTWFTEETGERWTAWAGQSVTVSPDLESEASGHAIGVTVKNFGDLGLPDSYGFFNMKVRLDGVNSGVIKVAASDTEWNTGWIQLGDLSGVDQVSLTWSNDKYKAGVYDANIGVASVSFAAVPAPASIAAFALACLGLPRGRARSARQEAA